MNALQMKLFIDECWNKLALIRDLIRASERKNFPADHLREEANRLEKRLGRLEREFYSENGDWL